MKKRYRVNQDSIPTIILTMVCFIAILYFEISKKIVVSERLEGYEVHGIDISHYQSEVDWKAVIQDSIDFVFMKATEGKTFKDPYFRKNWRNADKHGIIRGAYHFYRPSVHSELQAKNFIRTVQLYSGDLPPVLDLEHSDNRPPKIILKGVRNWLELIEAHYGVKPIIYVNRSWYKKYIKGNFDDYVVWLAAYTKRPQAVEQHKWAFWQYTDQGRIKGIDGHVDMNVFYGNREQLAELVIP